ncbi:MAG: STAS domain-containing protein [Phycisphaerales bacterium]|nr:STAS domain-containing protein [Phycisphaerales bacterium]
MEIRTQQHGAVKAVVPQGAICQGDAAAFENEVAQALSANMGRCVVDLSATPFVDSQGLESLLNLTERLADAGRLLKLCGVCETVREILDVTDLSDQFEVYEDVGAAVRSFL